MAVAAPTFTGFRPEAIQFLVDLTENNDRAWFQARKGEYETLLKEPLEALCVALGERFAARGIPMRADPAKSPFRICRDVRFDKESRPTRTRFALVKALALTNSCPSRLQLARVGFRPRSRREQVH